VARALRFEVGICFAGQPAPQSLVQEIFVLAFLLAICSVFPLHAQSFDASQAGGPITITAPWRFHPGDNPQWASPTYDDSQWPLLRFERMWSVQGYPGVSGYAWYRIRLQLPESKEPLALAVDRGNDVAEFYADGKLIGAWGRTHPSPVALIRLPNTAVMMPLPPTLNGRTIELAARIWMAPQAAAVSLSGSWPLPVIGTEQSVRTLCNLTVNRSLLASLPDWFVALVALVIGQISFGLFFLRPRATEYAWAGLYLFGQALVVGFYLYMQINGLRGDVAAFVTTALIAGVTICWLLLIWGFIRAKADWLFYAGIVLALEPGVSVPLVFAGVMTIPESYAVGAVLTLCIGLLIFVRLVREAWKGNRDAQIFLVPFLLNSVAYAVNLVLHSLFLLGRYWSDVSFRGGGLALYRGPYFTITWDQLGYLLSYLAIGAVLVRRFTRSAEQEQRLATEMESARQVQAQLVPSEFPRLSGFRIEAAYLPAAEVGGDFYQVFEQNDGSVVLVIGDVCGKGLKAAMTGVLAIGAARTLASEQLSPGLLLTRFNKQMVGSQNGGFITCICARISREGAVVLANAGHLPPYRNGEEIQVASGLPLGITPEVEYGEICVQLAPGDSLTFLSDGVIEARGKAEEFFGFERAQEISRQTAQAIANAAQRFGQEDDITVLTLAYTAPPVSSPLPQPLPGASALSET
jgi:phosphoserine phosphatase RsbU/P